MQKEDAEIVDEVGSKHRKSSLTELDIR